MQNHGAQLNMSLRKMSKMEYGLMSCDEKNCVYRLLAHWSKHPRVIICIYIYLCFISGWGADERSHFAFLKRRVRLYFEGEWAHNTTQSAGLCYCILRPYSIKMCLSVHTWTALCAVVSCACSSIDTFAPGQRACDTSNNTSADCSQRAPAEAAALKLDLFRLKDQIRPETQTSKVTSRKLLRKLISAVRWKSISTWEERKSASTSWKEIKHWYWAHRAADWRIRMDDLGRMDHELVIIMW